MTGREEGRGSARARGSWDEAGGPAGIGEVGFAKLGGEALFLQGAADVDVGGEGQVEGQEAGAHPRSEPDEGQAGGVKRMAHPAVEAGDDETRLAGLTLDELAQAKEMPGIGLEEPDGEDEQGGRLAGQGQSGPRPAKGIERWAGLEGRDGEDGEQRDDGQQVEGQAIAAAGGLAEGAAGPPPPPPGGGGGGEKRL